MKDSTQRLVGVLCTAWCLLHGSSALAYSVYGTIRYWDWRSYKSNSTGSLHRGADGNREFQKALVYAVVMNGNCINFDPSCPSGDASDTFVGYAYTGYDGSYAIHDLYESDEVYLLFDWRVLDGWVVDDNGDQPALVFSETETVPQGNVNLDWNISCHSKGNGTTCTSTDVQGTYTDETHYTNVLASISQARRYVGSFSFNSHSYPIKVYYPDNPGGDCDVPNGGNNGEMLNINEICVFESNTTHILAHEIGHVIHARLMDFVGYGLLTECNGTYGFGSRNEGDRCNVAEGFATFVSAAAHWDTNSTAPYYISLRNYLEGNTKAGNGSTPRYCVSLYSNPHEYMGNSARFFWDLYDDTQYGSFDSWYDDPSDSLSTVLGVWDDFTRGSSCSTPNVCTANREVDEIDLHGSNYDGRNVWDYIAWAADPDYDDVRVLNCLTLQSNN